MGESGFGKIIMTRIENPIGMLERIEYEWEGGPECEIRWDLLDQMDIDIHKKDIQVGPYRLIMMENCEYVWRPTNHYIRKDYPLWWLKIFLYRLTKKLRIIYERGIITMAVWGLARYDQAKAPNWRDIKLFPNMKYITAERDGNREVWLNGKKVSDKANSGLLPENENVWGWGHINLITEIKDEGVIAKRHNGLVRWRRTG